jgi:hypothetical protein
MYRYPHVQRPTINPQKSVSQNLFTGRSYVPRRIFMSAFLSLNFVNIAISYSTGQAIPPEKEKKKSIYRQVLGLGAN